ncbi:ion transporter [Allohahella sp. A8]|uniref:ion transporter n=1 Tax=Allohahella sp. A8 TaxID=3141461 RepID=UPI000C09019A|nr:ion transporter [Hahellaceae bacterium]|tara:strand:- start:19190 stop:20038 length:849 start_codon:yes stop_codon:yes gene_type:complete
MPNTANNSPLVRWLSAIESSRYFQISVITIIVISALTIGAKTYSIPPFMEQAITVLDWGITIFFLIEILLRLTVHPDKKRFFRDPWNLFDTIIVIGSLIPLEQAGSVLIGRLLRVFRVLRLVSVVPELRYLITALLKAIPRMGYIALLMFIIFYIYGAVGSLMFEKINPELWGDLSISMLTLFRIATFEDWTDVMYETMVHHPLSWIYYLTFIFLTAFIFLNMMVGAILEVMTAETNKQALGEAKDERDNMALQLTQIQAQLVELQRSIDGSAKMEGTDSKA